MLMLITYDVNTEDNAGRRRLRRVARACLDLGQRVQNSVFECEVDPAQWTHLRADGTPFDCEISLSRFTLRGEPWLIAIIRDVTEQKKLREIMVQTEKMMSVGGLAAGMAHELNNPLSNISSSAQIMPVEATPRITLSRTTRPFGSCAPGKATGALIPAFVFGAPQTMLRGAASPTLT